MSEVSVMQVIALVEHNKINEAVALLTEQTPIAAAALTAATFELVSRADRHLLTLALTIASREAYASAKRQAFFDTRKLVRLSAAV